MIRLRASSASDPRSEWTGQTSGGKVGGGGRVRYCGHGVKSVISSWVCCFFVGCSAMEIADTTLDDRFHPSFVILLKLITCI